MNIFLRYFDKDNTSFKVTLTNEAQIVQTVGHNLDQYVFIAEPYF